MAASDNPPRTLVDGRKVVAAAGTREQLSASTASVVSVYITALSTNTNVVVVGGAAVVAAAATRAGIGLPAGATVELKADQLSDIWVDVVTLGEGVSYTATIQ